MVDHAPFLLRQSVVGLALDTADHYGWHHRANIQRHSDRRVGVAFLEAQFNPFLALIVGSFMGMLLGFGVGAAQFLVLTIGRMPHAIIWVVVNVIGWGIGLSISAAFVLPLVISSLLSAIMAAVITGLGVGYFTTFQQYGAD